METSVWFTVNRNGEDLDIYISGDVEPGYPPIYYGHPDNWEPGSSDQVAIEAIHLDQERKTPWKGQLSRDETAEAEDALISQFRDDEESRAEDAAIAAYEAQVETDYYGYNDDSEIY